jgi:hypothetical protein
MKKARLMFLERPPIASSRPCPSCGGKMHYVATLGTLLHGIRKRICTDCGFVDPQRVKIIDDDQAA